MNNDPRRQIIDRSSFAQVSYSVVGGKNFLSTVIERARRGEQIKAISDAYGTPTYARDLARRLRELAQLNHPGIFHVANSGDGASYAEFAQEAMRCAHLNNEDRRSTDVITQPARTATAELTSSMYLLPNVRTGPSSRLARFAAKVRSRSRKIAYQPRVILCGFCGSLWACKAF